MKTAVKKKPLKWIGDAILDPTEKYRYALIRDFICPICENVRGLWKCEECSTWKDTVVFLMLNPSTATAKESDPTVRRCEGYATLWKYRRLVVLNLFAIRSTNPDVLYELKDPIGPKTDFHILEFAKKAGLLVCAWGVHGKHLDRGVKVLKMLRRRKPHYLKLTKDGTPQHPLYLKGELKPKSFFKK